MKRVRDQIGMCGRWGSWAAVGLTRDVRPVGVDAWRGAWDRIARRDRWGSRTWRGAIPARWAGIPRASPGSVQACGPRGRGRRQVEPKGGEETRTCGLLRGSTPTSRGAAARFHRELRAWRLFEKLDGRAALVVLALRANVRDDGVDGARLHREGTISGLPPKRTPQGGANRM